MATPLEVRRMMSGAFLAGTNTLVLVEAAGAHLAHLRMARPDYWVETAEAVLDGLVRQLKRHEEFLAPWDVERLGDVVFDLEQLRKARHAEVEGLVFEAQADVTRLARSLRGEERL